MYIHLSISPAKQSSLWTSKILATSRSKLPKARPAYGREIMIVKSILWTDKASKINTIQKNGKILKEDCSQHGRCQQKFVHTIKDENSLAKTHDSTLKENRYSFIKIKGRRPPSKNPWL